MKLAVVIVALWICQVSSMSLEKMLKRELDGRLRLVGGKDNNNQGRLEIYHRGQWGTVCDDRFDSRAAKVACRDLGLGGGEKTSSWQFGGSNGPIWISDVKCQGHEGRLTQCHFTGWGNTRCTSAENVGLRCGYSSGSRFNSAGGSTYRGSGTSGSRFSSTGTGTSGSRYGSSGTGTRYSSSSSSTHHTYSNTNRGGGSAIRPVIPADTGMRTEGGIQLVGGGNPLAGRLEIFHNGKWGTVCQDGFDDFDAAVACRQLGYDGGIAKPASWFGPGLGEIWLSRARCNGRENRLTDCPYTGWGIRDCHHTEDAGVECYSSSRVSY